MAQVRGQHERGGDRGQHGAREPAILEAAPGEGEDDQVERGGCPVQQAWAWNIVSTLNLDTPAHHSGS
jgi:hypothetical protein